ncbi:MAG: histidine kinase N-terminal 7TM domain-containing protein [Candidatus Binatia bacterium]
MALVFAAGLAAAMALVAWRRRGTPGGTSFAWLMLALSEWALTSAFEKVATEIPTRVLWAKVQYLGIAGVPPLWLTFALRYSRQDRWLKRRNVAFVWIMSGITVVLVATNEWHHALWTKIVPAADTVGALLLYSHGAWFWIFAAYTYLLLFVGTVALVSALFRYPHTYRYQAVTVLIGLAIPWVSNMIYLAGWSPVSGLDLTPVAFTITGVMYAWGLFRFQLFDLVPVARDAVIEGMSDGVVVLDALNRIADINPAAQRMIGVRDASLVGQSVAAVLAAWPNVVRQLRQRLEATAEIQVETDAAQYLDAHITTLHDHAGQFTGHLVLLRDITERKLLEHMREDVTHALVHDLRNPIAGISGSLEMLADDEGTGAARGRRDLLATARANAQRMLGLVNSILDVSRLESGQLPLERQPVQLSTLVTEALQLQESLTAEKQLRVENVLPADLPLVLVDPQLIIRVLHNLLDNAIKFTPPGGTIRVTARTAADDREPPGKRVEVTVSDSGPGIPPQLQGRLFQKFVSGNQPGRGSGLGLAFCRLAVETHGGRIWADGAPGTGTSVTFTLPQAD